MGHLCASCGAASGWHDSVINRARSCKGGMASRCDVLSVGLNILIIRICRMHPSLAVFPNVARLDCLMFTIGRPVVTLRCMSERDNLQTEIQRLKRPGLVGFKMRLQLIKL